MFVLYFPWACLPVETDIMGGMTEKGHSLSDEIGNRLFLFGYCFVG